MRRIRWVILVCFLGLAGCMPSTSVQLPDSGRVYFEDVHAETGAFTPLPNALVRVGRQYSCPRIVWLLVEGSVTGIDSYFVRTDADGYFSVPPKAVRIARNCKATMTASAAVPFMRSSGAFLAAGPDDPERYSGLGRHDVVVRPKEHRWYKYDGGRTELRRWLRGLAGTEGSAAVYREMLPEICRVYIEDPEDRYPYFTFREELQVYLDEDELGCLPDSPA